jgi:hypothetical protein
MDMSFARRRKAPKDSATPELPVLLAEMSARQGSSRTALVQSRTESDRVIAVSDPLIDIFAPTGLSTAATHRFSEQIVSPVIPRKLI